MSKYDNSGAIFRNDRKEKDTHPDHTGKATVAGVDYWISAWIKEKDGVRYFSLAFKPKEETRAAAPSNLHARKPAREMDDDIPF